MAGRGKPRFSEVVVDSQTVDAWDLEKEVSRAAVATERATRRALADSLFAGADEGSHSLDVEDGRVLKLVQGVDRKVDIGTLDAIRAAMIEKYGIDPDTLIKWEPKLKITEYRALLKSDPEAGAFFEQCLVITDSSPSMELVEPAAYKLKKAKRLSALEGLQDA